jgi:hypothetical protein
MLVDFSFSDADVVATCPADGWRGFGDSASDAFSAWWKHKAEEHPEED